jgi:hypothetical protein
MFNVNDVYSIQECLDSYKILLKWFPTSNREERDLKYIRMGIIDHLIDRCDDVIKEMKSEQSDNRH